MSITGLTKAFKKAGSVFKSPALADGGINAIKAAKTGFSTMDNLINAGKFTVTPNNIVTTAKNTPLSKVSNLLRKSDIDGFVKNIDDTIKVSSGDVKGIKSLLKDIPETRVKVMDDSIINARKVNADIDVIAKTGDDIAKLPAKSQAKITSAMDKIKKAAGTGLVVAGVVGVIALGVNAYKNIAEATEARNGCHFTRVVNKKASSCKITANSCINQAAGDNPCSGSEPSPTNYTIKLISVLSDAAQTTACGTALALDLKTQAGVTNLLNTKYSEFITWVDANAAGLNPKPCEFTHEFIEGGVKPACRACDSSAHPTDSTYYDTSDLADNISVTCVTNSTILETLIDVGSNIGLDLFNTLFGSASDSCNLTTILAVVGVVVAIIIVIVILSFVNKRKKMNAIPAAGVYAPMPPPQPQQLF